jgi:hypothetical protein
MFRDKVTKKLKGYQKILKRSDRSLAFLMGICHIQLGEYRKGRRLFDKSCRAMFKPPFYWKGTAQPNWLVDICVLSGKTNRYPDVLRELELFKKTDLGMRSLLALYAYGVMEFLLPTGWSISTSIQELLNVPKAKESYAKGEALLAINEKDRAGLERALISLLKAHEGKAKYGALRETSEGLLCMSAMSLAIAGLKHGLSVDMDSNYFSNGYIKFLLKI